ncbi:MAG: T9SS type A sorting domain-containing protein, partial [Cytophagaceae bacterium]
LDMNTEGQNILSFSIYPNPNDGVFNADVRLNTLQDVLFSVYDIQGNLIRRFEKSNQDFYSENISFTSFERRSGLYLIRVETKNESKTLRFTVR